MIRKSTAVPAQKAILGSTPTGDQRPVQRGTEPSPSLAMRWLAAGVPLTLFIDVAAVKFLHESDEVAHVEETCCGIGRSRTATVDRRQLAAFDQTRQADVSGACTADRRQREARAGARDHATLEMRDYV